MKLFADYGLFVNSKEMARKSNAKINGIGFIKNYCLRFRSFATIEQRDNYEVPTVVWRISDEDEAKLDLVEGVAQNFYSKHIINVTLADGSEVEATVYILKRSMEPNMPNLFYATRIKEGYIENGLPLQYLANAFYEFIADGSNSHLKPFMRELESLIRGSRDEDVVPAEVIDKQKGESLAEVLTSDLVKAGDDVETVETVQAVDQAEIVAQDDTPDQAGIVSQVSTADLADPNVSENLNGVPDSTVTDTSDSAENPGLAEEVADKSPEEVTATQLSPKPKNKPDKSSKTSPKSKSTDTKKK